MDEPSKKWVAFFQDTQLFVFRVIPGALGVSESMNLEFNSLCVPRKAKEAALSEPRQGWSQDDHQRRVQPT